MGVREREREERRREVKKVMQIEMSEERRRQIRWKTDSHGGSNYKGRVRSNVEQTVLNGFVNSAS